MAIKLPSLLAFFQAQEWVNDHAVDVGQSRPFDAAPILLSMTAGDFRKMAAEIRRESGRDLDLVVYVGQENAGHDGPFVVDIHKGDYLRWLKSVGFDPDDIASVDDRKMENARAVYGVQPHVPSGMKLLASTKVEDWRLAERAEDELSEMQKVAWPVRVYQGVNGGIELEFDAPDGTQRIVAFEIDRGNLKILPSRDRGVDLDAVVVVEPERILISHYAHGGKAVAFHEGGVDRAVEYDPVPSFADAVGPKP